MRFREAAPPGNRHRPAVGVRDAAVDRPGQDPHHGERPDATPVLPGRFMMVWRPQRGTAPTADEDEDDDPARVIVDVEMEKSLLYLGARYGNDVSKLFFAHHT